MRWKLDFCSLLLELLSTRVSMCNRIEILNHCRIDFALSFLPFQGGIQGWAWISRCQNFGHQKLPLKCLQDVFAHTRNYCIWIMMKLCSISRHHWFEVQHWCQFEDSWVFSRSFCISNSMLNWKLRRSNFLNFSSVMFPKYLFFLDIMAVPIGSHPSINWNSRPWQTILQHLKWTVPYTLP